MNERKLINDFDDAMHALGMIAKLEADWDGEGSAKPDAGCLAAARRYMAKIQADPSLAAPVRVLPTSQGTICFEWHNGNVRREAEFVDGRTVEWILTAPGSFTQHWNTVVS